MSKFTVFDQSSGMYVHPNNFLDPVAPYVFNSYDEALAAKWEMLAANRDQKHPDSIDIEPFVVGEEPGGLKRIMEPDDRLFFHEVGRHFRITAIFTDMGAANAYMAEHPEASCIAEFPPFIFLADKADKGVKCTG